MYFMQKNESFEELCHNTPWRYLLDAKFQRLFFGQMVQQCCIVDYDVDASWSNGTGYSCCQLATNAQIKEAFGVVDQLN